MSESHAPLTAAMFNVLITLSVLTKLEPHRRFAFDCLSNFFARSVPGFCRAESCTEMDLGYGLAP